MEKLEKLIYKLNKLADNFKEYSLIFIIKNTKTGEMITGTLNTEGIYTTELIGQIEIAKMEIVNENNNFIVSDNPN